MTAPQELVMKIALENLPGMRFGLVTVVKWSHRDTYWNNYFECLCDCGEPVTKRASQLRYGKFHTCGAEACRFWEKVDKNGPVISKKLGPCHVWTGALHTSSYGVFKADGSKTVYRAHVYAWELEEGPVPDGLWVLHKCDNRPCVRKGHLFLGDHDANMHDMALKGRAARDGKVYLSDIEKQRMIDVYSQGGSPHPKLAADFGVSLSTVRRTLRGASSRR
jgi:hypothetical protein